MFNRRPSLTREKLPVRERRILFCSFPGFLSYVARQTRQDPAIASPLLVADGRVVRDACPLAAARGIRSGRPLLQARRLCPAALVIPLETLSLQRYCTHFLDLLAEATPLVEPLGPDAAFAELIDHDGERVAESLATWAASRSGLPPVIGAGPSRLAARACAECRLPASQLSEADVTWLWPEDPKITARLQRLGLLTFGAVAALPESVLVHQFGKTGRLLALRARGVDLTPVRALYPPPRADVRLDLSEYPVEDTYRLDTVLSRLSRQAAEQLIQMGRHGRRIVLRLTTEREEVRRERELPLPVQSDTDLFRAVRHLAGQTRITAAITAARLLVEEAELPTARTLTLFPDKARDRQTVLQQTRHTLHAKFGVKALQRLSELPIPLRDERRTLMREAFGTG